MTWEPAEHRSHGAERLVLKGLRALPASDCQPHCQNRPPDPLEGGEHGLEKNVDLPRVEAPEPRLKAVLSDVEWGEAHTPLMQDRTQRPAA